MNAVSLTSAWADLLPISLPAPERRKRWAAWIRLARPIMGQAVREWAGHQERCVDCAHSRGGWCTLQGLPCSFNPFLTPRTGWPGMACMGAAFCPRQLDLPLILEGRS